MNQAYHKDARRSGNTVLVVLGILLLGAAAFFLLWPSIDPRREARPKSETGRPAVAVPKDARASFTEALQIRNPDERKREAARVMRKWVAEDRDAAVAHLSEMSPGPDRTQAILVALDELSRRDVERALALARELIRTREERSFYSTLFTELAGQDPAAATRHLGVVPAGESRTNAIRAIAGAWGRRDAPAALDWAGKLPDAVEREAAREAALTELASADPVRAIAEIRALLTGSALQRTLRLALQKLALKNPPEAAEVVKSFPAGDAQVAATIDVARAFAARDPAAAIAWTKTLADSNLQRFALHTTLETWAARDPIAAGKYVAQMEPGTTQMTAAANVGRVLARTDPQQATAWAQGIANSSARDFALVSIAGAWAPREPAKATEWASGLPAGDTRNQALHAALSHWVLQDAPAAQKFVTGLKGELQAAAATTLAPLLTQSNPKTAMEWARTLPAPEPRDAALAAAYRRWREISAPEAEAWLKTTNLPAVTKSKLQKGK